MINKKEKIKAMNEDSLQKKAVYIAKNLHQKKFGGLVKRAKDFWLSSGGTIGVEYIHHGVLEDIHRLNRLELANAVTYYILNHGEEMAEMERAASQRYRDRKRYAIAVEKIRNGFCPVVYRGHVSWVQGTYPGAAKYVNQGYFPVVKNKELAWEPVPYKCS